MTAKDQGENASAEQQLIRELAELLNKTGLSEIEIETLPADIPEHIDIDASELMLHEGIRVRDIPVNPKWKPVSDADLMLVHVIMPKAEEVAAPAEAVAATATTSEPEVIKKGKKEEAEPEKDEKKK